MRLRSRLRRGARTTAASTAPSACATAKDNRIAVAKARSAGCDDAITLGDTVENFRPVVAFNADLHRMKLRDVINREVDATRAVGVHNRVGGHYERVRVRLGDDADARIHAGLEAVLIVGNLDLDRRRARRWIQYGRHARDASHEVLTRERVHLDAGHVAHADLFQVLLDDVRHEPDARDVDDIDDRRVLRDKRAGVGRTPRYEAVDGRRDDRVLQVDTKLVEARLRLRVLRTREIESGLRRLIFRFRIVERLLWKQLALEEVSGPFHVGLGEIEVRFALPNGGLRDFK